MRIPSTNPTAGTNHLPNVVMEDLLDAAAEEARDGEGQRQRRQIATRLDRIDGLARDVQLVGELTLAQAPVLAQPAHLVRHACKASLSHGWVSRTFVTFARSGRPDPVGADNSRSRSLLSWRRR